jgi:hypothetical protein
MGCLLLTLAISFFIHVKAASASFMTTTLHTLLYTMSFFSLTAPLAGHMVCLSRPTLTQQMGTMKQMTLKTRSTSHRFNSTLTASTHDRMSFQFFNREAACSNNTYATCGFQVIKTVSDGSKPTSLSCALLCTAALKDAVGHGERDVDLHDIGHRIVLPSSYTGGPRYMNQRFQDAIALARYYHGFDLFITFTTNALWPEITNALLPRQVAADRPELTVRVFNMYKTSLDQ